MHLKETVPGQPCCLTTWEKKLSGTQAGSRHDETSWAWLPETEQGASCPFAQSRPQRQPCCLSDS